MDQQIYSTEGVENDAHNIPQNLTSASRDLDVWTPEPQSWSFRPLVPWTTCANLQQNGCEEAGARTSVAVQQVVDCWLNLPLPPRPCRVLLASLTVICSLKSPLPASTISQSPSADGSTCPSQHLCYSVLLSLPLRVQQSHGQSLRSRWWWTSFHMV